MTRYRKICPKSVPEIRIIFLGQIGNGRKSLKSLVPAKGVEPLTFALQVRCTAYCATPACFLNLNGRRLDSNQRLRAKTPNRCPETGASATCIEQERCCGLLRSTD